MIEHGAVPYRIELEGEGACTCEACLYSITKSEEMWKNYASSRGREDETRVGDSDADATGNEETALIVSVIPMD